MSRGHPEGSRTHAEGIGDEGGFTLVELLVATVVALGLIGVAAGIFTSLLGSEPRTTERSTQIESGRVMLERATRELRQGTEVAVESEGQRLELLTSACSGGEETCDVVYDCDEGTCTRTEGEGSDVQMVSGLDPEREVFEEDPVAETFVEIWLSFPQGEGQEAITLGDGVAVRNYVELEEDGEED